MQEKKLSQRQEVESTKKEVAKLKEETPGLF